VHAIVATEFGPPGVLRPGHAADPVIEAGWTVVTLRAAALNWHDVLVRQGLYDSPLPHVLGADGAGVDESTGEDVVILPSLFWGASEAAPAPGWEILGDHRPGTYAERVRVPTECVAPRPPGLSWVEAAALPLVGVTTYRALFGRAGLRSGESLLVLGAGGGVATMAVMLASAIGCRVIVTSSSDGKIEQSEELGAVGGVRYDAPDWPVNARSLSPDGEGFDVVLDPVGTWVDSVSVLKPGGRLVVLGASRGTKATLDTRAFYFGQHSLLGTTMGSPRDFAGLLRMMESHDVRPPVVDRSLSLDDAASAHTHLESGTCFGKVVLTI
jgi:NADPH:quinone reductase-like Zn-dependent oxidoreductase